MTLPYPGRSVTSLGGMILTITLFLLSSGQLRSQTTLDADSYSTRTSYGVANPQRDIFTGDLDGDGKPDMVIALADTNMVAVYKNTGTPQHLDFTFQGNYRIPAHDIPGYISTGDLDGDGKPDLVVSNRFMKTLSIFRNTSAGGKIAFADAVNYPCGVATAAAAIADFNRDGHADIAIVNSGDFTLTIFRNTGRNGVISFAAASTTQLHTYPMGIVAADLDGDGKVDFAISNYDANTVSFYRNMSTGSNSFDFAPPQDLKTEAGPVVLRTCDLDSNGKTDLVTSNYDAGSISIFRNTSRVGAISFSNRQDLKVSHTPMGISIADLDKDGKPDLIVTDMNDNSVWVLKNLGGNGTNTYAGSLIYATDALPLSVLTGDLDGDGKPELATANLSSHNVSLLHGKETQPPTTTPPATPPTTPPVTPPVTPPTTPPTTNPPATPPVTPPTTPPADSTGTNVLAPVATSFKMYPNPTRNYVIVTVPNPNYRSQFSVIDMTGRSVKFVEVAAGTIQTTVDLSGLSRSTYALNWTDGINRISQTVILQ